MSKALDIAENLALLSTKYTSSTSTLDSVALGSSTTGTFNGTIGSSATFPAGHVLQVKNFIFSKIARTDSASFTQITDGSVNFELSITPTRTNSKILMLSNIQISSTGQYGFHIDLYSKLLDGGTYSVISALHNTSSTTIGVNSAQGGLPYGSTGYERFNFALQYLDESISSLDKRWYTFYYRTGTGGYATVNATPSAYTGSTNNDFGKNSSQMTLMEIAG